MVRTADTPAATLDALLGRVMARVIARHSPRIRAARLARGLTQAGLAAAVGASRSAVSAMERGAGGSPGLFLDLVAELDMQPPDDFPPDLPQSMRPR
jgi:DNA-binding XRE family transcriptional regulator